VKEVNVHLRVLFVLGALAGTVQASSIIENTFGYIGIYYGSAELFSPGGTLLSTTLAMTAETQFGCPGAALDQNACGLAVAQSVAQGFSNPTAALTPPLPPVFSQDFLNQLPALEDNNGLGNVAPLTAADTPFDPNNAPTAASDALYADLTAQAGNFGVTGDTGFVEYGGSLDYTYVYSVDLPVPAPVLDANGQPVLGQNGQPECCITTVEGAYAVQFFERDLQLTEAIATPEPRKTWLAIVAILLASLARRRFRQMMTRYSRLPIDGPTEPVQRRSKA
jgi:hypothetical protein